MTSPSIRKRGEHKYQLVVPARSVTFTIMHPHHHSLEGNNPLRGTDYMEHAPSGNQGIVDGRPEGRQPKASPILLDTVIDQDASADDKEKDKDLSAQNTIPGATSRDVYGGLGVPIQGMSSNELRHGGRPGRKRQGGGVEQFGEVDDASGRR